MVYGGKTHVLPLCLFCHLPLSTSSNLFNVLFLGSSGSYDCSWLEAVIVFGSGVAGLSFPFPHAHSTHDYIHGISLSRDLPCSPSRISLLGLFVPSFGLFTLTHMRFVHSCAEKVRFFLTQRSMLSSSRTGSGSIGSHAARKGAAYRWSSTFSTKWNRVCFPLCLWLLIRFGTVVFPIP